MSKNETTLDPIAVNLFVLIALFSFVLTTDFSSSPQALAGESGKSMLKHSDVLEEAIKMRQTHFFMGTADVTIAQSGIRIENISQLKYTLVAKAPEWRIYVYRTDDKTYFSESLEEFEQTGLMSSFLFPFKSVMLEGKKYAPLLLKIDGFNIIQLTSNNEKLRYMDIVTLPQQVKRIMYVAYKLPTNGYIPIAYSHHVDGVDMVTRLNRNEIENALVTDTIKRVKVSPQEFEIPPLLNPIKSLREVVSGNNSRERSEDAKALLGM